MLHLKLLKKPTMFAKFSNTTLQSTSALYIIIVYKVEYRVEKRSVIKRSLARWILITQSGVIEI